MPGTDNELIRARRKLAAYERAKLRLRQRLESIDFELDELLPKLKDLEAAASRGELPEFSVDQ